MPDPLEVTEADIAAVKAFHNAAAAHMLAALKDKDIGAALGENNTGHPIYQAFAAHRIAAEQAVESKWTNVVSHATGGHFQDATASTNEICVQITQFRNRLYQDGQAKGEQAVLDRLRNLPQELLNGMSVAAYDNWGLLIVDIREVATALAGALEAK